MYTTSPSALWEPWEGGSVTELIRAYADPAGDIENWMAKTIDSPTTSKPTGSTRLLPPSLSLFSPLLSSPP